MNAWKTCPIKTVQQAIAFKSNCLGLLLKVDESGVLRDFLIVKIGEIAMFLNVGKNINDYQIEITVDLILSDNIALNLTFEDYKIIFDRYIKGQYGKSYDRFDGQVLFECINSYSIEKQSLIEQKSHLEHDKYKSDTMPSGEVNIEGMKKVAEEMKKALGAVEVIKKVEKPVREKSTYEKLIQKFFNQFYQIWLKRPYRGLDESKGRFINRYGIVINETEYVELKIKQHDRILKALEKRKQ